MKNGVPCPECGRSGSAVISSRRKDNHVRRRRMCSEGHRWSTKEEAV